MVKTENWLESCNTTCQSGNHTTILADQLQTKLSSQPGSRGGRCQAKFQTSEISDFAPCTHQRWSDSGFLLSDPILFWKNDIRIRPESCFGWNHTIHIWKLSESVLWCTTYIFVLCLFCLMRQKSLMSQNNWSYFAFSWTRLVKVVNWQVWNGCPA